MIRKINHIAVAFLLFLLTMGFTVSKHFCGDTMVEISFYAGGSVSCSDKGMDCSRDDCCRNENHTFQLDEDYTSPIILTHVPFFQMDLDIIDLCLILRDYYFPTESSNLFVAAESPPPGDLLSTLSNLQVYRL